MKPDDVRLKNLTPFKKGQKTVNPHGRPKKLPHLEKLLAEVLGDEKDNITAMEAILKALRAKAVRGDLRAAEILLDRAYGKSKQYLDLNLDKAVEVIISSSKAKSKEKKK